MPVRILVWAMTAAVFGVVPTASAQETQAPVGSELSEPYNPFESEQGNSQTPETFQVPTTQSVTPQIQEPAPTPSPMLEPNAGVQPLDIPQPQSTLNPASPEVEIDQSLLKGTPVEIPPREQVVPTPEATRQQVPGVTN